MKQMQKMGWKLFGRDKMFKAIMADIQRRNENVRRLNREYAAAQVQAKAPVATAAPTVVAPSAAQPAAQPEPKRRRQATAPAAKVNLRSVPAIFFEEDEDPRHGFWPVVGAKPSWLWNTGTLALLVKGESYISVVMHEDGQTIKEIKSAAWGTDVKGLPEAGQGWHYLTKEWVFGPSQQGAIVQDADPQIAAALASLAQDTDEEATEGDDADAESALAVAVAAGEEAEDAESRGGSDAPKAMQTLPKHLRPRRPMVRQATAKDSLRLATGFGYSSQDVPTPRVFWSDLRATDLQAVTQDEEQQARANMKQTWLWAIAFASVIGAVLITPLANSQNKPLPEPKPPTYIVVTDANTLNAILTPTVTP